MDKKRVIIVTDGDDTAQDAIEEASNNLGLRVISKSGGNPTRCSAEKLVDMIKNCPKDPVVVMADDEGNCGYGIGERIIGKLLQSEELEVLGVIAVASNAKQVQGVRPECCIDKYGEVVPGPVDKDGMKEKVGHKILEGDTLDIMNSYPEVHLIGIGDIGKMSGKDSWEIGAPITTKALEEILRRSGVMDG